jgi:hypothetical protein
MSTLLGVEPLFDNPAPFVFANGSAMVLARGVNESSGASSSLGSISVGRAVNWRRGPYASGHRHPIFPRDEAFEVGPNPCNASGTCEQKNIEDPFLWRDARTGWFHALVHNGCGCSGGCACPYVGRHGFSKDGSQWTLSRRFAYTSSVEYVDGTSQQFYRRERPHLTFDERSGTPTALFTAVMPLNWRPKAGQRVYNDASYLLAQPILSS